MAAIQNQRFADQTVELNGNSYSNCSFERCYLGYCGDGEPSLHACTFVDVTWVWEGAALATFRTLSAMYNHLGPEGRRIAEKVIDKIRSGTM
jgi:hypothetical protein